MKRDNINNKTLFCRGSNQLHFNLQHFAENNDDAGTDNGDLVEGGKSEDGHEKLSDFDKLLSNKAYQAEFDRRLSKALETQKTNLEKDRDAKIEAAKTEAEKLAKMNAEQKVQYEKEKHDKDLANRETLITRRELTATAREALAEKELPLSLSDILDYSDADNCNKSIEAVEKAFREAVGKSVDDKLKGGKPLTKAPDGKFFTRNQIDMMSPDEINNNWDIISKSMSEGNI